MAEKKTREVPEDRIKTLSASVVVDEQYPEDVVQAEIARMMARQIVERMFRFRKVRYGDEGRGMIRCEASLEVIVPPTPLDNERPSSKGRRT